MPPKNSSWDGSVDIIKAYMADTLNDPDSIKYESWSKPYIGEHGWDVQVKYRAKNGFGAYIKKTQVFTISKEQIRFVKNR